MQWKSIATAMLAMQVLAQLLLLFMLEPGFDLSAAAFVLLRRVSMAYLVVSVLGGLFVSHWVTIIMAIIPVVGAAVLAVAYWYDPAPLRALRRRLAQSAGKLIEQQPPTGPDGQGGG